MEKYNLSEDEVENVFYKMNNMEIESKIQVVNALATCVFGHVYSSNSKRLSILFHIL